MHRGEAGGAPGKSPDGTVAERVALRRQRRFYPEVQALRAVAIGMVLLFHFASAVPLVQGGFVGVDVFFVISGYLISSHLVAELDRTGRIRLGAFYARRARRLLPASLSVLLVVGLTTPLVLPRAEWADVGRGLIAAAGYAFNLYAGRAVALDPESSVYSLPVVHYWSLSAEEQFYLVWPPLMVLAAAVAVGLRRRGRRVGLSSALGVALGAVAVASFGIAVAWTWHDHRVAFFVTPARAWEFAAGGLVTLVLRRWAPTRATAGAMRWVGVVLILPGSLVMAWPDVIPGEEVRAASELFPGPMALPAVVGTTLVILAGATVPGTLMHALVSWRPVQWLGLISYSVYLWHWPLIPYAEATWDGLGGPRRLALLALALALGHVWQRWVEDATRYVPGLKQSTRGTLWAALAGMLVVAGVGVALWAAGGR